MAMDEIGVTVPDIVLLFSKSAVAIQAIQSQRVTPTEFNRQEMSTAKIAVEKHLLRALIAGASKIRVEYHEYVEAHNQVFLAGDDRSRYLLSRCRSDTKVMYQIVRVLDNLTEDCARKLLGMVYRCQRQAQAVMAGLGLRIVQENGHAEFESVGVFGSVGKTVSSEGSVKIRSSSSYSRNSKDSSESSRSTRSSSGSTMSSIATRPSFEADPLCPVRIPPMPPTTSNAKLESRMSEQQTQLYDDPDATTETFPSIVEAPHPSEVSLGLAKLAIYSQSMLFSLQAKDISNTVGSSTDASKSIETFCPGARRIQEDPTLNYRVSKQLMGRYAFIHHYRCPQRDCPFEVPLPCSTTGTRLDTMTNKSNSGVHYRWIFLAKSHTFPSSDKKFGKRKMNSAFKCLACHHEAIANDDIYEDPETLMWHLRNKHGTMSMYVQKRLKCVVARDPLPGEDFDLFIPLADESTASHRTDGFEMSAKADKSDAIAKATTDRVQGHRYKGSARLLVPRPSTELIIAMSRPNMGIVCKAT